MDKKILLGGVAALIMGAGSFATPASSSALDLSIGGSVAFHATMTDECFTQADAAADDNGVAHFAVLGLTDAAGGADDLEDAIDAVTGGTSVIAADTDADGNVTFAANPCDGDRDNPRLGYDKKLTIDASGTLANGLEVSFSDELNLELVDDEQSKFNLTFGGAFGSLNVGSNDSAVKASAVFGQGDMKVAGNDFEGHALSTAGTGNVGLLYTAPSMGALDLMISYNPNSTGTGYDDAPYLDTFGFGLAYNADALSVSFGYEAATLNSGTCHVDNVVYDGSATTAAALVDAVYGTDVCGDQTLMAIGAAMSAGSVDFDAGYTILDSDEADRTTTTIGMSTDVGEYGLSAGYTNSKKESKYGDADTEQTVIGVGLSTSLGDGVGLSLNFSNNTWDDWAQRDAAGGNGSTTDYYAQAKISVGF